MMAGTAQSPSVLSRLSTRLGIVFRRRRRHPFDFSSLQFPKLDVDYVLASLSIREHAQENGSHEIPATTATEPDGPQQRIVQHVSGEIAELTAECGATLLGLDRRIRGHDVDGKIRHIRQVPENFARQLSELAQQHAVVLGDAQRAFETVDDELRKFKKRLKINRDPSYPESRVYLWLVIVFLIVVEAILNAYFFAMGSPLGRVGGAGQALVFAIIDIPIVFGAGRVASRIASARRLDRILGAAFGLLGVLWIVCYNLVVAHFRDQFATFPENAATLVLQSLKTAPFGLRDLNSWLLFFIGAAFSTGGAVSGLRWDDPIPGYGSLHRRHRFLHAELEYQRARIAEEATDLRDNAIDEIARAESDVRNMIVDLENAVGTKEVMLGNIREFIDHYEGSCNVLIRTYRDLNIQSRQTPPPAYFQSPWVYPTPKEYLVDTIEDRKIVESQRRRASEAPRAKKEAQKAVHEAFEEVLRDAAVLQ